MIKLYGINNCDTIKKTKKWLDEKKLDYEFHDYKKLGCSPQLAKQFIDHLPLRDVINTRGTTWRKLPDKVKNDLNKDTAIDLMVEQSSVIKRPIFDINGEWMIGFDTEKLFTAIK
jgi:arsenate reductase (glutaredoxin)